MSTKNRGGDRYFSAAPAFVSLWLALLPFGLGLVGVLPAAESQAHAEDPLERGSDTVAQILLDARKAGIDARQLARRLVQPDPEMLPLLFAVLENGRFGVRVGERGNVTRALTFLEREAVVAALAAKPWSEVIAYLEKLAEEPADEARRRTALELLGARGTPRDLKRLLQWSEPFAEEEVTRIPRERCTAFAGALGGILDRHPDAASSVSGMYKKAHLSLVPSTLSTLGTRPGKPSLWALADLIGLVPDADPLVLAEICHVATTVRQPIETGVLDRIRPILNRGERSLLIEAILAAGRLGDIEAIPRLIELLDHGDRMVSARAQDALEALTGEFLGSRASEWSAWYAETMDWWDRRAQEQIHLVRSDIKAQASRAILELSKQRMFRHELAKPLSEALLHEDEEIVILTCATLGHLASPLSVSPLLEILEAPDVDLRRAAYLALRRITEEDHGEDPRHWRDAGW